MTDLAGKAAIVTGASRNLGRGFAEMLGKRGASVLVHYHTDESRPDAETTASLVRRAGGKAEPIQADFTDANAVESLPKRCLSHFGRFDILINGAAQIIKKSFQEISGQEFDRLFAINTKAPFLLMRAAAMHMASGGRIVNIGTSILACSFPCYSIYAGSKAPLEQFTRALAKEVASRGITVNTIAPGALDTPFFYSAETEESVAQIKQFTGGLGKVDDVVPTVEFLVSPGAHWLTGQTIFINGGFATR